MPLRGDGAIRSPPRAQPQAAVSLVLRQHLSHRQQPPCAVWDWLARARILVLRFAPQGERVWAGERVRAGHLSLARPSLPRARGSRAARFREVSPVEGASPAAGAQGHTTKKEWQFPGLRPLEGSLAQYGRCCADALLLPVQHRGGRGQQ